MDTVRLGVLIWLFLPIPGYWLIRRWYAAQIRKYPATTSGRIVSAEVSYSRYIEDDPGRTSITYAFDNAGARYKGQVILRGTNCKLDKEILIRFIPERPEELRLDNLSATLQAWEIFGVLVLGLDLGLALFVIFIGLLCLLIGISIALRRVPHVPQLHLTPRSAIFLSPQFVLLGIALIPVGVYALIADGLLDQNILWAFWNH